MQNILGGLDRPTSGDVAIRGRLVNQLGDRELTELRRPTKALVTTGTHHWANRPYLQRAARRTLLL